MSDPSEETLMRLRAVLQWAARRLFRKPPHVCTCEWRLGACARACRACRLAGHLFTCPVTDPERWGETDPQGTFVLDSSPGRDIVRQSTP